MISVIIPAYNASRLLPRCLNSLLEQTYRDFEAIIVDDGSSDDSLSAIQGIIGKDSRFSVISQPHQGASSARNAGIRCAQGEYICFIDADDYVKPNYLFDLVSQVILHPGVDLVVQGLEHWQTVPDVWENRKVKPFFSKDICLDQELVFQRFDILCLGSACAKLFRRNIISEKKIEFPESVYFSEDLAFLLDYLSYTKSIIASEHLNYVYADNYSSLGILRPFEMDFAAYRCLLRKWKQLLTYCPSAALQYSYSSFIGNYSHRLLQSILLDRTADRRSQLGIYESDVTPDYLLYFQPESSYTKLQKWLIQRRLYHFYKWLILAVNWYYHIPIHVAFLSNQ